MRKEVRVGFINYICQPLARGGDAIAVSNPAYKDFQLGHAHKKQSTFHLLLRLIDMK